MQVYNFLVLAGLAFSVITALDHHHGHRDIGKGTSPIFGESSTAEPASSVSTESTVSQDWGGYSDTCYYPGVTRSTFTTTVTYMMSPPPSPPPPPPPPASASASSDTSVSFPVVTVSTTTSIVVSTALASTTTTTVIVTTFPNSSDVSLPSSINSSFHSAQPTASASDSAYPSFSAASSSASVMDSSLDSLQPTASASSTSLPASTPIDDCPREPFNKTNMPVYFGFNVNNKKPIDPSQPGTAPYRTPEDWNNAFALLKQSFPQINAVRMYSTTDDGVPHLHNAMPAARANNLSILAGVWSSDGTIGDFARFNIERDALEKVFQDFGCKNIAAISVGNEDLNSVNLNYASSSESDKNEKKQNVTDMLLNQISQIRNLTRDNHCCNIPITHTDTWNEFSNTSNAWIPQLISAVDQATIVNIFPYWSQAQVASSWQMIAYQSDLTANITTAFGKDVWLGETGWATWQPQDTGSFNEHGTNVSVAQQYFSQVGCGVLNGTGTGFYYVDWDENAKPGTPTFGLFNHTGQVIQGLNLDCSAFKPDMRIKDYSNLPAFMGISQAEG